MAGMRRLDGERVDSVSIGEIGNFAGVSDVSAGENHGGDMGVHLRGLVLFGGLLAALVVCVQVLLG